MSSMSGESRDKVELVVFIKFLSIHNLCWDDRMSVLDDYGQ